MSEEQNSEVTHWKRNLVIGITIISIVMILSFAYYAKEQSCIVQHDSLSDRFVGGVILDTANYAIEYQNFKDQCSYFYEIK